MFLIALAGLFTGAAVTFAQDDALDDAEPGAYCPSGATSACPEKLKDYTKEYRQYLKAQRSYHTDSG